MKKRFTEEQTDGFPHEAWAGLPIKECCRQRDFSTASCYVPRNKFAG
ncbi:hypothetical protein GAS18_15895 [Burkholderia glumae]|nr:hypothetical protein GAS18_15895 [Burkholderia glumae]